MKAEYRHYWLDAAGDLQKAPSECSGNCIPYLSEKSGRVQLCVIEGGAYHKFDISPEATARLAEEAAAAVRRHIVAAPQ